MKSNCKKKDKKKISFFQSIKVKLISGFILPVVGIIVLGVISYNKASTLVIDSHVNSAEQNVASIQTYLGLVTDTVQSRYKGYLNNDELKQYFSGLYDFMEADVNKKESVKKSYQTEMFDNVNADALIEDIIFLGDGDMSFGTNTISSSYKDPYTSFLQSVNGQTVKTDEYAYHWFGNKSEIDKDLGANGDAYSLRLVRKFYSLKALMIIDVDMDAVTDSLDTLEVGEGGYVALVTADGSEIFSTSSKTDGNPVFTDKDFYKEAIESDELNGSLDVEIDGEKYRFIYSKIDNKGLTVCSLISEDYLLNKVKDIQTITFLIVIVAVIVAIAVGIWLAGGISKTINSIIKGLNKVANGDFTVHISTKRKDEFKLITDALSDTVERVKNLISGVQDVNAELVQSAKNVYNSSTLFMDTTENIKSSVDEIKSGAYRLDDDSDNCLAQMDKLSEKIEIVTANTNEIGRIVDTTNQSIIAGVASVESVTESTNSTTRITGEVIGAIEELQDKSRSIVDIVNAINEIAEQTTLLSLNASIEAARAGEAGKGFSVVASEISKLADQSLTFASQIGAIIDEILEKTNQVVDIAKEAFKIVQEQNESVSGTTEAFEDMKHNINTLLNSLEEITHNVVNIESARALTLESVAHISEVSEKTASCSVSVAETVDSQNSAIRDLNSAAATLSDKSALLTELLQKFTV